MMFDMQAKKFEIEHRANERKENQDRHDRLIAEERNRNDKKLRQQNRLAIILAIVSGTIGIVGGVLFTVASSILAKYLGH